MPREPTVVRDTKKQAPSLAVLHTEKLLFQCPELAWDWDNDVSLALLF